MAYVNKELTSRVRQELKDAFPEFKFSVKKNAHSSTLIVSILSGNIDFADYANDTMRVNYRGDLYSHKSVFQEQMQKYGYSEVNVYWFQEHFTGKGLEILSGIYEIAMKGNHDRSDAMTDYFDVGWYFDLCIGKYGTPYVNTNKQ